MSEEKSGPRMIGRWNNKVVLISLSAVFVFIAGFVIGHTTSGRVRSLLRGVGRSTGLSSEERRLDAALVGSTVPKIAVRAGSENTVLEALVNGPSIVVFWSMDCQYCKALAEDLSTRVSELKSLGISVHGLSMDADSDILDIYVERRSLPWQNSQMQRNDEYQELKKKYGLSAIPAVWFLDENKVVIDRLAGFSKSVFSLALDNYKKAIEEQRSAEVGFCEDCSVEVERNSKIYN